MATADKLLERIFCWIEEKERFADKLKKLAKELESLREICNASECVGSSVTVVGAACMIGAGFATLFSSGAAAPLMGLATAYTGIGSTISVGTKIIESFCSRMKKLEIIEEKSNKIAKEMQQLFQKLESEKKEANPFLKSHELEHHIMAEFLGAIARHSGLNVQIISESKLYDMLIHTLKEIHLETISDVHIHTLQESPLEKISDMYSRWACGGSSSAGTRRRSEEDYEYCPHPKRQRCLKKHKSLVDGLIYSGAGFLSVVLCNVPHKGKAKLRETVLKVLTSTAFQRGIRGGVMVAGGAAVLTFALPGMIDNWKKMIKGNHVTKASKSLRDTADRIQNTTQKLKEQIKRIKKTLEIEQEQQKLQEIEEEESSEESNEESSEEEDPPAVNVGLLNVRSIKSIKNMKEKRLKIKKLITDHNLDVFLLTETWLENDTAYETLRETVPPNFKFHQQSREDRGGGVAILVSNKLRSKTIDLDLDPTPFEYVATALRHDEWDEDVLLINVYHPPRIPDMDINIDQSKINPFEISVGELETLMRKASTLKPYNSIIVAGDFNVHVEDPGNFKTGMFKDVCVSGFKQHVKKPTHKKGGFLDLVYSRNVEVKIVDIRDDGISDHFTVYFSIKPLSKD